MRLARFAIPTILKRLPFTQLPRMRPQILKSAVFGSVFMGLSLHQTLRMEEYQSTVVSDVNEFCCVLVLELTEADQNLQHEALTALKEVPSLAQKKTKDDGKLK